MLSSRSTVKCRDVTFAKIEECVLEALCLLLVVDVWTLYNGDDNYWIISLESPDNQSNDFNLNGEIFGLTPSRSQ